MATIVETGIRNIQACVIMETASSTPQLLVSYDTHDAGGETIRRRQTVDWYPTSAPSSQTAIQTLIAVFTARAKSESEIP